MAYKVEVDEIYNGYRCVVIFGDMGHRCGYVGVGKDHPLYGVDYNEEIPDSLLRWWEVIKQGPIGKRGIISVVTQGEGKPRLDVFFDVHGSLTYSGGGDVYPVDAKDTWWFGFDCGHCGDGKDFAQVEACGFKVSEFLRSWNDGVIRDLDYVWQECKNLADQLKEAKERVELYRKGKEA